MKQFCLLAAVFTFSRCVLSHHLHDDFVILDPEVHRDPNTTPRLRANLGAQLGPELATAFLSEMRSTTPYQRERFDFKTRLYEAGT